MTIGSGMLVSLLETTDKITQDFIFDGYASLVSNYKTTIFALVGLSITAFGYAVVNGWVQLSLAELSKRVLIIGFSVAFAIHWDFFSKFIYIFLVEGPNAIALHLVQAIPSSHYGNQLSINNALQQAFYDGISFGQGAWDRGSWSNELPWVWAALIWLVTYCFSGIALLELITAKFGLAILLVLSPLIFPMMLFPASKAMLFNHWTRHLLGFALVPIFVMSSITLSLMLISQSVDILQIAIKNNQLTLTQPVAYVLCSIVNIGLVKKSAYLAVSLAAGFSMSVNDAADRISGWGIGKLSDSLKLTSMGASRGIKAARKTIKNRFFHKYEAFSERENSQ